MYNGAFGGQIATNQEAFACADTAGVVYGARAELLRGCLASAGGEEDQDKTDREKKDIDKKEALVLVFGEGKVRAAGCATNNTAAATANEGINGSYVIKFKSGKVYVGKGHTQELYNLQN